MMQADVAELEPSVRPGSETAADRPRLAVHSLTRDHGAGRGCFDVSFVLWPGEVIAVVGESGSGKSTLLACLGGLGRPDRGQVLLDHAEHGSVDLHHVSERARRDLLRTTIGFVHQNPRDGLRMNVSAGANVGERLMALGWRHWGRIRAETTRWLARVELDAQRIDDRPSGWSGGMQQRLQIARSLVTAPRVLLLDEPTAGLDVSVQARLLDLLRTLVRDGRLAVVIVTHDLAVARLLADRTLVMQGGRVVESGLTDQVLEDPQAAYTQLLVSAQLQA